MPRAGPDVPRNGFAIQCRDHDRGSRRTTSSPDYGRMLDLPLAGRLRHPPRRRHGRRGRGHHALLRLDAGQGDRQGPDLRHRAAQRMDRALREFRIRGVKTNIPFLENVIAHPLFRSGQATTTLIDTTPELFQFTPRRDRATKLLNYLGEVIVNGNPHAKGYRAGRRAGAGHAAARTTIASRRRPARASGCSSWARSSFAEWIRGRNAPADHRHHLPRRAPVAHGHAHAHLRHAGRAPTRWRTRLPELFSLEMWGGATFDTAMRFLQRGPVGAAARAAGARCPTSASRCCSAAPTPSATRTTRTTSSPASCEHAAEARHGHLPHLRLAQLPAQHAGGDGGRAGARTPSARRRSATPATSSTSGATSTSLKYYVASAKELERMGAHILAIKDMAGLCKP